MILFKPTCMKILLILLVSIGPYCFGQNSIPTRQSNYSLDFNNFLSGVKYAKLTISTEIQNQLKTNPDAGGQILGIRDRLKSMGFEYVAIFDDEIAQLEKAASLCDIANFYVLAKYDNKTYYDIKWYFWSCNKDTFEFDISKNIHLRENTDVKNEFYNLSIKMYGYNKPTYNKSNRLILNGGVSTSWNTMTLKEHFIKNGFDEIEGIYENTSSTYRSPKYILGLVKELESYNLIYLSGANNYEDWIPGNLKAKLIATSTPTLFKTKWYMNNKTINNDPYITFEKGFMNLIWPDNDKNLYLKTFPTANENLNFTKNKIASGTGFAISQDGLIATNHHVVDGANSIYVRGVKGDFSKIFIAKIIVEDKNNDLAIIKIDDPKFTALDNIPFVLDRKSCEVGTSIFVLGFPLRATMGDEIKLTNGIISSKSGFQGDITTYQITAAVQPGNSGGPLFDNKGNLVGIVNAKHSGAENASYAIKASYLLNLLDLLPEIPKLQTENSLSEKTLPEQVKSVKSFTYIIEVKQ